MSRKTGNKMVNKENSHINHRQRMKSRALNEGLEGFDSQSVLELMLFYVLPQVDTKSVAKELIEHFGSFDNVFSATVQELTQVRGIKQHSATFIKLIPEFSRYYLKCHSQNTVCENTNNEIKQKFISYFAGQENEMFVCIFFDDGNNFIDMAPVALGTDKDVSFSYRTLVNEALRRNAYKIAIAHNHPSGVPVPSFNDFTAYNNLKKSLSQVNIDLIDSFIVGNGVCVGTKENLPENDCKNA